jgi:hypothetical protein
VLREKTKFKPKLSLTNPQLPRPSPDHARSRPRSVRCQKIYGGCWVKNRPWWRAILPRLRQPERLSEHMQKQSRRWLQVQLWRQHPTQPKPLLQGPHQFR